MSKRRYSVEEEYGIALGVDTTSPLPLLSEGFVREARNADVGHTGGYSKRKGITAQLTTAWAGDLSIRQGYEYRQQDPNAAEQLILFGTDDSATAKIGRENGAGGVDDLLTGLSADYRMSFVQMDNRLFLANGDSTNMPRVFNGTSFRELGIAAPLAAPTTAVSASSGALTEGSYILAYTYVIEDGGQLLAESSASLVATQALASGDTAIDIDVIASLDANVTSIRIYRTVVDGSILFLDQTVANSDQTVTLSGADAGLEAIQLPEDNSQLADFSGYSNPRFPIVARNRLFVVHNEKNEVRFSKIGQNGPEPESFPALSFSPVEGRYGASDRVVGQGELNGVPIILKERSIGRLDEVGLQDITQAEDSVAYIYRPISESIGAVDHHAQTQVRNELVFLGQDNVYATDGVSVRAVGDTIQETIRQLDFTSAKAQRLSMANDRVNQRVYIACYEQTTASEPNFVLVGDYNQGPSQQPIFRWTFYGEGSDSSTHPGIRAGSFFYRRNQTTGLDEVFMGNTDGNGQYYKMGDGDSDVDYSTGSSLGIAFRLVSRPYAMKQPMITKLFKTVRIQAEASSSTATFEFCSQFDLRSSEEFCKEFIVIGSGTKWNQAQWGPGGSPQMIWGGGNQDELVYDPHRKAKFMQMIFKQEDADAPITLTGWTVSGTTFGPDGLATNITTQT